MKITADTANRQIARAAGVVMAAFVLSNITGLIRQILVSQAFGTEPEIDAFNAAARLPELVFSLIAGGALASAFVPVFTRFLTQDDRDQAWHLASATTNLVALALMVVSLISWLLAPQIVRFLLVPFFDPEQQALTVSLLRILLLSPVIFGISGLAMGILNAHQSFLLPALAPTMYWLGMIFGVLALVPILGIHGLAWGAVLGAGLHLGVQIPGLLRLKGRYHLSLGLRHPAVREVGLLMTPRLIGVAVVQINFWVNTILASGLPEGSLTSLVLAWAIMTMPQVVIAQAIAIAALPTFAAQAARDQLAEMRASLAATLRGVILLAMPAALGLIILREPIVALLFERDAFGPDSTQLVAWALLWFSVGLVSHSVVEVVSRAYYALKDTRTPVTVGAIAMGLNIAFSLAFIALFNRLGWPPHGGLALANSLATTLEMGALWLLMRRRLDGLEGNRIFSGAIQAALATLVMSLGLWAWMGWAETEQLWLVVGGGVVLGLILFALTTMVLRVPEAKELVRTARGWLHLLDE